MLNQTSEYAYNTISVISTIEYHDRTFFKNYSKLFTYMSCNGVFALPETETDTETKNKKMGCVELCRGVHTTQRQTPAQILIEFCVNL